MTPTGRTEGLAITTIEHLTPQVIDPLQRNVYANCAYACRQCNTSRRATPAVDIDGSRLLNPAADAFAEHIDTSLPVFAARTASGAYTIATYDINAPEKVAFRECRAGAIQKRLDQIKSSPEFEARLLAILADPESKVPEQHKLTILDTAAKLRADRLAAVRDLYTFDPIPLDAPLWCRCGRAAKVRTLPSYLEAQLIEIPAAA